MVERGRTATQIVLADAFAALSSMATNAPGPTQKRWATRAAGECLWALGIDEYEGFKAVPPDGMTIEGTVVRLLEVAR